MLDFNDIDSTQALAVSLDREAIRSLLLVKLESVLLTLFPEGKKRKGVFLIGDVLGSPGDSLEVVLTGDKAGLWTDRATGDGGDIFALIAAYLRLSVHNDFAKVLTYAADLVGRTPAMSPRKAKKEPIMDELGPATAKWHYLDAQGELLAVVYRYDPPGGKKEFRPWDAKRRKKTPPTPRPLYNQPGIMQAHQVILVEGEKCAEALIQAGYCATTAMHGANAPVDKTDWSPLAGKAVLVWPDKDKPGWTYAEAAARAALHAGATSCDILIPPDTKPEGWDAADALAEANTEASAGSNDCEDQAITSIPPFDIEGFIIAGQRMPIVPEVDAPESNAISDDVMRGVNWGTEDGIASAFTRRFGQDWRYCAQWSKWLVWTGQRWNEDLVLYIHHLTRGICRASSEKADSPRLKAKLASASTISAVERMVRAEPTHAASVDEWDSDIWLLNTPGGVVDLRTGNLRGHLRLDRMTKMTTATPRGDCPQWLTFLEQITDGDQELQAYLQRVAGYCLSGSTQEHALFFLYGTGSNGKSVFVNTLFTILGDYAANAPMETFMETRTERHPTDLAGLRGSRLVTATETEQGRRWNEAKIKEITGGDRVTARFMRQDYFTYSPQFKLVISGNHKPSIRNVDEAMKRRMHLVPFTVTIPAERRDRQLPGKLLRERDGILAWALAGSLAWLREGLRPPESVLKATSEYFEEEDAIGEFLEEDFTFHEQARESVACIFQRWKERADKRGEYVGNSRWLVQQLIVRGYERARLTGGVKALAGLMLKPKEQNDRLPYRDD